jgi:hypothetical protein
MRITLILNILGWIGLLGGLVAFFVILTNGLPRWREEGTAGQQPERLESVRAADKVQRV